MSRNRLAAAMTVGTMVCAASTGAHQPPSPALPAPRAQAPVQQNRALSAINAQQLARAALIDGRSIDSAAFGPAEARYIATLLRDAAALDPTNAAILRFAIEAAERCGDQAAVTSLTRALLALRPDDTSAQLNLIRSRVAQAPSVEEQLTLLDTFTGPRGDAIDPSIRSRLALDAALLRREQGDGAGFVKNLAAATTFDGSNAAAAALALEYYSARAKDEEGRFELLANALLSMPMDGGLHAEIARVLAVAGATEQALRFYENARTIYRRQSGQLLHTFEQTDEEARLHAAYLIQAWRTDGPQSVVKPLNDAVEGERRRAQVNIDVATATGNAVDRLPTPDSIRLPIPLETVRAAAAYAAGDRSTLDRSLTDLSRSIAELAPDHPARVGAMVESAYLKALARGGDINADISALRFRAGVPPKAMQHLEAWAKLRSGNRGGREQFEAMKDDPIATLALLAMDVESTPAGDTPAAKAINDRLAALAYERPETTISAWAMSVYASRNAGKTLPVPERAARFNAMAAGIPAWLDGIAAEPARFVTVRAEPAKATLNQLEPAMINIQISNNTPVPLAVGPDQTIDSRMLLVSAVDIGGTTIPGISRSEVAVLGGRLRLLPRETATFSVWADPGMGGWLVQNALGKAARQRYEIIQGFRIVDGNPAPGPSGIKIEAGPIGRASLPVGNVGRLTAELATLEDADLALALLHARLQLIDTERKPTAEQAKALVAAVCSRYRRANSAERLAILLLTPPQRMAAATAELSSTVVAVEEADPVVARAALLTRVASEDSPLLAKFRSFPDAGVQEAVRQIEARFKARQASFATGSLTSEAPPAPVPPPSTPPAPPPPAAPVAPPTGPNIGPVGPALPAPQPTTPPKK